MSNTIQSGMRATLLQMESELTRSSELAESAGHTELVNRLKAALVEVKQLLARH